jgi:hypothetical protein
VRSRQLETALGEFVEEAAIRLQADLDAGAEVPFELGAQSSRGRAGTPLYCYRPLIDVFIRERWIALTGLASYPAAVHLLAGFEGLDRYLLAHQDELGRAARRTRRQGADTALRALLEDVFVEQSDFARAEIGQYEQRLRAALDRLDSSAHASATEVVLLATLHGLTITSPELPLAAGLTIARPGALDGVPEGALAPVGPAGESADTEHLLVAFATEDIDALDALARGRDVLGELLRALRLFGDGRVTLGRLAWSRVGVGSWSAVALGGGGRPHGMLVVGAEQEDELRAFCNLVSRRRPRENELAWALSRFEMGCERPTELEALSDYLLALRGLLEPEGASSGLLPGRLAALCATPGERLALVDRVVRALALERATIVGTAQERMSERLLVSELEGHLRALLRDVVCGHLQPDLVGLADRLLLPEEEVAGSEPDVAGFEPDTCEPGETLSGKEEVGDAREASEVLDVLI